jgi:tetratricopeptide (TPR) repeat protein
VQGNILAGEAVVAQMERAFLDTPGPLAGRLVTALESGQAAGGDVRGQQSAAVVVERVGAAADSRDGVDRVCDLRVDDHAAPIGELRRLLGIHAVWDSLRRATRFHASGRYEDGVALLAGALADHGEDAALLYDLACFECLAGRRADALGHLDRALELDPELRPAAAVDRDFAALAGEPAFVRLLGG